MPQVSANGVQLEYEELGERGRPAVVLIMGCGVQLTVWPAAFCQGLADAGFRVIRFDNRDVGRSTKLAAAGVPSLPRAIAATVLGLANHDRSPRGRVLGLAGIRLAAPYTLEDMARDVLGLMDALRVGRAHLVGVSMGAMIGQVVSLLAPERTRSLVSIMGSSGNPALPRPRRKVLAALLGLARVRGREATVEHELHVWRLLMGPGFPVDWDWCRAERERDYDRGVCPEGFARNFVANLASGSRLATLPRVAAPTLIIQGTHDPVVHPQAARELAEHIPGARLEMVDGMGHVLAPSVAPVWLRLAVPHLRAVDGAVERRLSEARPASDGTLG